MLNRFPLARLLAAAALASLATFAWAQTTVNYGRITAVNLITEQNRAAQTGGAILGGALGASAGSNPSSGTRALRAGGGVLAGQQLGRVLTQRQAFEYTILIGGTSTVRMVTDEAGLRIGDCVAVERGQFNNLRLVDDSRCNPPRASSAPKSAPPPAPKATAADVRQADACIQAKDRLLDAETEDDFERAYRRVRLLCSD
jgi:outer membrane lipoprotein SlyB